MNIKIEVASNFPNRWHRELVISTDNTIVKGGEIDCRSDRAKELALDLIWAGTTLLCHHELFKGEAAPAPIPTEELNQSLSTLERLQQEFKQQNPNK
jgi:hypothetical protein